MQSRWLGAASRLSAAQHWRHWRHGRRWSSGLAAEYNPRRVEDAQRSRVCKPREEPLPGVEEDPFVVLLPPPNVTGALHIGHALTISIEDALVRYHRMCGRKTVWIPGTDHAGIATQVVVEKDVARREGVTRHDLGRDAFTERVWEWKRRVGDTRIAEQMRQLGASVNTEHTYFTLDDTRSEAVQEAFVRLHEQGLIYRSQRLVNWCPHLRSAISDVEVDYVEVNGPTWHRLPDGTRVRLGHLHHVRYPVVGSDRVLSVATTRPETMAGDAAVAVHPDDPRYADLVGGQVVNPLYPDDPSRALAIIADSELVDPAFGTGVVKVTPAADFSDHACALRHGLPMRAVCGDDGRMVGEDPALVGLDRFAAREAVVARLDASGLYEGAEDHAMRVAVCSRTGDVLEPLLKPQWHLRVRGMCEAAAAAVDSGAMVIQPEQPHRGQWGQWMGKLQDWCLSRQLWWGHRVPAWRVVGADGATVRDEQGATAWVVARSESEAWDKVRRMPGAGDTSGWRLEQDEDVLDTWFSSALLPLSAQGWPARDPHVIPPVSVMETGADIMVFWVARMVFLCSHFAGGRLPFPKVHLHQMVRDAQGRKMSKSLGNVIDPSDLIHGASLDSLLESLHSGNLAAHEVARAESDIKASFPEGIAACGADALRFALCDATRQAHFVNLDPRAVLAQRRFANKIWNAARLVASLPAPSAAPGPRLMDAWLQARMAAMVASCRDGYEQIALHTATEAISQFFLSEFCDVYLEYAKLEGGAELAGAAMEQTLRAVSPMMPFISAEVADALGITPQGASLADGPFATPAAEACADTAAAAAVDALLATLGVCRAIRAEFAPARDTATYVVCADVDAATRDAMQAQLGAFLTRQTRARAVVLCPGDASPEAQAQAQDSRARVVVTRPGAPGWSVSLLLPQESGLGTAGDGAASTIRLKELQNRRKNLTGKLVKLEAQVSNPEFQAKVPDHVRERMEGQVAHMREELAALEDTLAALQ